MPGDRHDAGHRLQFAVEGGGAALRAVLAEAGNGTIDQARVERAQRFVAEAETLHDPRPEILPHDVRVGREALGDLDCGGLRKVERDAALVAVDAEKRGPQSFPSPCADPSQRTGEERRMSSPAFGSTLMTSAPSKAN